MLSLYVSVYINSVAARFSTNVAHPQTVRLPCIVTRQKVFKLFMCQLNSIT